MKFKVGDKVKIMKNINQSVTNVREKSTIVEINKHQVYDNIQHYVLSSGGVESEEGLELIKLEIRQFSLKELKDEVKRREEEIERLTNGEK